MADIEVFENLYLEEDYPGKGDKCVESPLPKTLDVLGYSEQTS